MDINQDFNEIYGRDDELAIIHHALSDHPKEDSHIYFFHGNSGVGKTTLCHYILKDILPKDEAIFVSALLDARSGDMESENLTIRILYEQLIRAGKGFVFPKYELACAYLTRTRGGERYKIDHPRVIDSGILNDLLGFVSGRVKYGDILNYVVQKFANKIYTGIQVKRQYEIVAQYDEWTIEEHLIDLFIQDYNENLERLNAGGGEYHAILLCDSFEHRACHDEQDWLTKKLIPNLRGAVWIIFSTEAELNCPLDGVTLSSHKIRPFDTSQTDRLLDLLGVQNKTAREFIVEASEGLPAAIQIMARTYHDNGDVLASEIRAAGYQALFEQYFSRHLDEQSQSVAKRMSVFDEWDRDVYVTAIGSDEGFQWLTSNTALVEQIQDDAGRCRYRFVNIVQEAMLAMFVQKSDPMLMAGQKGKFTYYSRETDRIIESIQTTRNPISNEKYKMLTAYCKNAFDGAIHGYADKLAFRTYSDWCIKTEQFMSTIGFFDLKAELLNQYINGVLQRDGFRFDVSDTNDNEECRYYLNALRDLVWAYRNTGEWGKAIHYAGEYYIQSLKRYGANNPRIPFCLYLLGLTFRDVCDHETAQRLFENSLELYDSIARDGEENLHPDTSEPVTVLVNNLLGYMYIDNKAYPRAYEHLLIAQENRSQENRAGYRIGYGNLSKLYFYWSLSEAEANRIEQAAQYIQMAEDFLRDAVGAIPNTNDMDKLVDETRKILLLLAKLVMQYDRLATIQRLAECYHDLVEKKNALIALEQPSSTYPYILSIENNLAVICALQKNFEGGKQIAEECLNKKRSHYSAKELREEHPDTNDRIIKLMQNRPTICDTEHNLKSIQYYIDNPNAPFNPYEFILQY